MLPRGNRPWPVLSPELCLGWMRGTLSLCPAQSYAKEDTNCLNNMNDQDFVPALSGPVLAYRYKHNLKYLILQISDRFQILIFNKPIPAHEPFLNVFKEKQVSKYKPAIHTQSSGKCNAMFLDFLKALICKISLQRPTCFQAASPIILWNQICCQGFPNSRCGR